MNNINIPWTEKYRPKLLKEIESHDTLKIVCKNIIRDKNMPHMLFHGPSGCGKTSTILALMREIFGKELWKERVIEFNASDERGINVVRDKIKSHSKIAINTKSNYPSWKMIILDEADSMTSDSQFALRRILEIYSKSTRFCIICNYINKIIDPIISRCSVFKFSPLPNINIENKLNYICNKEDIEHNEEILKNIILYSRGDLRKSINYLQKSVINKKTDNKLLLNISGYPPIEIIDDIIETAINLDYENALKKIKNILYEGYSFVYINHIFYYNIKNNNKLTSDEKYNISFLISDIDNKLNQGSSELIQFLRLIVYIIKLKSN